MRTLVIQLAKMGDIIQSGQALKALAGDEIDLLHNGLFSAILPFVADVNPIPVHLEDLADPTSPGGRQIIDYLNSRRYDRIVNLNSAALAGEVVGRIKAPLKTGWYGHDQDSLAWLYYAMAFIKTRRWSSLNLVDIYRGIVSREPLLAHGPHCERLASGGLVSLQLASRNVKRQWPVEKYAELGRLLHEQGYRLRLLGATSEEGYGREFVSLCPDVPVENLIGKTSVNELVHRVGESNLLLTPDTGTMHIASLTNTPVVALFMGPAFPQETLVWQPGTRVLMPDFANNPCYPCGDEGLCPYAHRCADDLSVSRVAGAVSGDSGDYLGTDYDELGQVLDDDSLEPAGEDRVLARFYRDIARRIFYGVNKVFTSQPPSRKVMEALTRELTLYHAIVNKGVDPVSAEGSFLYLSPFITFYSLTRGLNNEIVRRFTDVFTAAINMDGIRE